MEEKKGVAKAVIIVIGVALFAAVVFFAGRYVLYVQIRNAIQAELASLSDQDVVVSYDHMEVLPWSGKIEFFQLRVKVRKDSMNHGLDALIPYVLVKGVGILPFLANRTLSLSHIAAHQPQITYEDKSALFSSDTTRRRKIQFDNISVDEIDLPGFDIYVKAHGGRDTLAHVLADIEMADLYLKKQNDSLTWEEGDVRISSFAIRLYRDHYAASAARVRFAISDRRISVDSLRIKPVLNRQQFMAAAGREATYMEGMITSLDVAGIDWYSFPAAYLDIDKVSAQFAFQMYRDKRYPDTNRSPRALPSHLLHRLPVSLTIDTIRIDDSYVAYEEYPEQGDSTGTIFFDRLHATIHTIHNNPALESTPRMIAYARFMGAGELNASFAFSNDTAAASTVKGRLTNMPLDRLNNMLGSAARTKVETGMMTDLSFRFSYNATRSSGEVTLSYENLKVLSLRENRNNEQAVSPIKTLLLNTLVLGKDIGENVTDDTRTGAIDYPRDPYKSVFNYWWKSVFSGVLAAYKLDKLPVNVSKSERRSERKMKRKKEKEKGIFSRIF